MATKTKRAVRKTVTLSAQTIKAIGAYSSNIAGAEKAITISVDGMVADGVTIEMMYAPEKGADREFYASLETAVIAGFLPAAKAMLNSETKALAVIKAPDNRQVKCKANKKYWQQQVASRIKDLRNALDRRLNPKKLNKSKNNPKKPGKSKDNEPMEQSIRRTLVEAAAKLRAAIDINIAQLPDLLRTLDAAIGYIPAPKGKEPKAA